MGGWLGGWVGGWSIIDNKANLSPAELRCCWSWAELGKNKYINKNKSFNDNCQRAIEITIKVCDHYAQIIQLLKKYFKRDVASITVQLNITKPCIFQYNINDKVVVNMITVPICFHLLLKTPREVY